MVCSFRLHKTEKTGKREENMEDIFSVVMVGLMVLLGGVPSIYILVSMPLILAEKIYGKVKYGKSLYD